MNVTCQDICDRFSEFITEKVGECSSGNLTLSSFTHPKKNTIVIVTDAKQLETASNSDCSVIAGPEKIFENVNFSDSKTYLKLNIPGQMFLAKVGVEFFADDPRKASKGIHPSAIVSEGAEIDESTTVAAGCVVERGSRIGSGTFVGANTYIGENVKIGSNVRIYPLVFIGNDTEIGDDCIVQANSNIGSEGYGYVSDQSGHHAIPQLGNVVLENAVEVGANVCIDRATLDETRIKSGTKIDNHCHIGHNNTIGNNCLITAGFISAGSSTLGDRVIVGGRTSVTDHVTVCDDVHLAGLSGVSKDVEKPGAYGGYPLQPLKEFFKTQASFPSLPRLRKDVAKLLKKIGVSE